jgi:hypothetical protein
MLGARGVVRAGAPLIAELTWCTQTLPCPSHARTHPPPQSFQRVLDFLVDKCELNDTSVFIDIGSGLGKPNFHAAVKPAVKWSIGIELEEIRWQLSMHNLSQYVKDEQFGGQSLYFAHCDVTKAVSLNPCTHVSVRTDD